MTEFYIRIVNVSAITPPPEIVSDSDVHVIVESSSPAQRPRDIQVQTVCTFFRSFSVEDSWDWQFFQQDKCLSSDLAKK